MDADALPVRINCCGWFKTDRFWRLGGERTRSWTDLDLWLLAEGAGTVVTPEGTHALRPGTCLIMRGGEAYEFRPASRSLSHYFVHFDYLRDGRAVPPDHPDLPPRHRRLIGYRLVADLLERVVADHHRVGGDPQRAPRWLATALLEIARQDRGSAGGDPRQHSIDELCERIRDDPAALWRSDRLAVALGVGADRFARIFRQRAGCSPRDFITRARIDLACNLLCATSLPIAAVAERSGFGDPHFFSRHFARHCGRSPLAYRREAQG